MALPEHAPHIPHIPIPDVKGAARWALTHWKPVSLSLAALAGSGYLAFAQDRGPDTSPVTDNAPASDTIKPPSSDSPAVVINPGFPTQEAQATAEAQKPAATEVKKIKELTNSLLSSEIQKKAEVIRYKNPDGQWWLIYAWKKIDQNVSIAAPGKGSFSRTLGDDTHSMIYVDTDQGQITIDLYGGFRYPTENVAYPIDPNQIVALTLGSSGPKDKIGNEDFEMDISVRLDAKEGFTAESILQQILPDVPKDRARTIEASQRIGPTPTPSSIISVSPRPIP